MATTADVKLARIALKRERAARRAAREDRLWNALTAPEVLRLAAPIGIMAATYFAGKHRVVNRDLAGFMFGLEAVQTVASLGVNNPAALLGVFEVAGASYAVAVPPKDSEAVLELHPSKLLGGDRKLFFWEMPASMPE